MKIKEIKLKNVPFTIMQTDKFKTVSVFVYFKNRLTRKNTTMRSLLSRVLGHSTKEFPTKGKMIQKQQDLYDAIFGVSNQNIHECSYISFHMELIDEELLSNHTLFSDGMDFLRKAITEVNAADGAFDKKVVQEQKRLLESRIKNIYNNKDRYAYKRFLENIAPDEAIGISTLGYLEDLKAIDEVSLYKAYEEMLRDDEVSVIILGNVSELKVISELSFIEDFAKEKHLEISHYEKTTKTVTQVKRIEEVQSLNQTKLIMGYRIDVPIKDPLFDGVAIFSAMFGGLFVSSLFREIREKHSLAYSIFSHHIPEANLFVVRAGIDAKNVDKTIALITEELDKYQSKRVSKELFDIAKENLLSEIEGLEDSPNAIANFIHRQSVLEEDLEIASLKERIANVKLKDVLALVQRITLDTIYVLKGEQQHADH